MTAAADVAARALAGPVTADEIEQAYAAVLAEHGLDACCPRHPARLSRSEALGAALAASDLIAGCPAV